MRRVVKSKMLSIYLS